MPTFILPVPLPVSSTVHAARVALWEMLSELLPLVADMSDVAVAPGEPDQLPADGVWLGGARVVDIVASLGGDARTETAEIDITTWVARDGNDSLYAEERAWEIRDAIRALVRDDINLGGAANLWSEPSGDVLQIGIAPAGGARCALLTSTVTVEIRS